MIINSPEYLQELTRLLNVFLHKNRRVWSTFEPQEAALSNKSILVDCMVTTLPYLMGNLITAKYLQKRFGYRIHVLAPENIPDWLKLVFRSYGADKLYTEALVLPPNYPLDLSFLETNDVKELRSRVLSYRIDDIEVGDLLYDSYLRFVNEPTIDEVTPALVDQIKRAHAFTILFKQIIQDGNVELAVMGHMFYMRFGLLARLLINAGGEVYGKGPGSGPFTVRRYKSLDNIHHFSATVTPEWFDEYVSEDRSEELKKISDYLDSRMKGVVERGNPEHYLKLMWKDQQAIAPTKIYHQLGLDPNKPTICIFAHVFIDAAHCCPWNLYHDYYEWLVETLEIAKRHPELNWVVRRHPGEKIFYEPRKDGVGKVMEEFSDCKNIALLPDGIKITSVMEMICGGVTVAGTSGLEMSAYGIPIVLAGQPHYAGRGFTIEPKTFEEYEKALVSLSSQKVTQSQMERARLSAYCSYFVELVTCKYMPVTEVMVKMQVSMLPILQEALDALEDSDITTDPVYVNLMSMLDNGYDQMINFDQLK